MKGIPFVNRKYTKGKQASSVEKVYKRVRGWTSGGASPYKTLLSTVVYTMLMQARRSERMNVM